jgi:hypothetical protein
MPQRFLKPGITTSTAWNEVGWQAQSFYVRLLTLVDDYGRYDARWQILRSYAFPLHQKITCKQMLSLCEQLHSHGLAVFYRVDEKEYVQLTKWREKARTDSRFPVCDDSCEQMFSNVNKCSLPSPSPSPSPSPDAGAPLAIPDSLNTERFLAVWSEWQSFRRKGKPCKDWPTMWRKQLEELQSWGVDAAIVSLNKSMASGWQGIFEPNNRNGKSTSAGPIKLNPTMRERDAAAGIIHPS